MVHTIADISKLGTIVGIWAHPDDETFSCGGLLAAAVQNGQQVVCITATKGEAGVQDAERWPPEDLGEIRAAEMDTVLHVLGISNHHWLDYRDGSCADADADQAIEQITTILQTYQPDTILTFGPDGLTGHPDHQTVSAWAHAATKRLETPPAIYHVVESRDCYETCFKPYADEFGFFFNIEEPPLREEEHCDICLALPSELFEQKLRALRAMPSQTERLLGSMPADQIHGSFSVECFEAAHI